MSERNGFFCCLIFILYFSFVDGPRHPFGFSNYFLYSLVSLTIFYILLVSLTIFDILLVSLTIFDILLVSLTIFYILLFRKLLCLWF